MIFILGCLASPFKVFPGFWMILSKITNQFPRNLMWCCIVLGWSCGATLILIEICVEVEHHSAKMRKRMELESYAYAGSIARALWIWSGNAVRGLGSFSLWPNLEAWHHVAQGRRWLWLIGVGMRGSIRKCHPWYPSCNRSSSCPNSISIILSYLSPSYQIQLCATPTVSSVNPMVSIIATVNHCDINSKEHKMKPTFINHQRNRRCIILLNSWSETNESPQPRRATESGWHPLPDPIPKWMASGADACHGQLGRRTSPRI